MRLRWPWRKRAVYASDRTSGGLLPARDTIPENSWTILSQGSYYDPDLNDWVAPRGQTEDIFDPLKYHDMTEGIKLKETNE